MMDSWGDGWGTGTLSINGIDYTLADGSEGTAEISMNYGDSFDAVSYTHLTLPTKA